MSEFQDFVSTLGIVIGLLGLIGFMGICVWHIVRQIKNG